MNFEYPEDRRYFEQLLCEEGESLDSYCHLFDFRAPDTKRKEFEKMKRALKEQLLLQYGEDCLLRYAPDCDARRGVVIDHRRLVIDHVIPLNCNRLNKELRQQTTFLDAGEVRRKVPHQSYGSNHRDNLVLACFNCNSAKSENILNRFDLKRILKRTLAARELKKGG